MLRDWRVWLVIAAVSIWTVVMLTQASREARTSEDSGAEAAMALIGLGFIGLWLLGAALAAVALLLLWRGHRTRRGQ